MPAQVKYASLPLPLIMNGKVLDKNLEQISQTRFWLKNQIQYQGLKHFKEVELCTVDHRGKMYIVTGE
ncbi:YetF domain-containing protein [Paenibacillus sp. YPG26]|uniref:YetF domain-containing protein n=1 Tax=Paenibacillus sp. YPG26 TaxID=2878915 RepID=UPI003209318E